MVERLLRNLMIRNQSVAQATAPQFLIPHSSFLINLRHLIVRMRLRMPPFFIIRFIMVRACSNRFMRAFTSCTVVPEPAAMRLRREAFKMFGLRRSC